MWSYIFINYYLAGLYFGAIDSAHKHLPIKIHFDEIICEVILSSHMWCFYKIHPNSIRIMPSLFFQGIGQLP